MAQHLWSRYSRLGQMALALHATIGASGLRLPPRRELARWARMSEATVGRRLQEETCTEERLISALVQARTNTYPPGYHNEGWARWLPEADRDLADVRVWLACLELAAGSPDTAAAVNAAWVTERGRLAAQLLDSDFPDGADEGTRDDAEILQAYLLGLSIRRALDPDLAHERAGALLDRLVAALRPAPPGGE
jgi:DNA-binding transcriptional MocR family regulator